jgi:hypothetical protein
MIKQGRVKMVGEAQETLARARDFEPWLEQPPHASMGRRPFEPAQIGASPADGARGTDPARHAGRTSPWSSNRPVSIALARRSRYKGLPSMNEQLDHRVSTLPIRHARPLGRIKLFQSRNDGLVSKPVPPGRRCDWRRFLEHSAALAH